MSTVMDRLLKYGLAFVAKPGKVAHTSLVYILDITLTMTVIFPHTRTHILSTYTQQTL